MFDPTKINIDLENQDEDNNQIEDENIKKTPTKKIKKPDFIEKSKKEIKESNFIEEPTIEEDNTPKEENILEDILGDNSSEKKEEKKDFNEYGDMGNVVSSEEKVTNDDDKKKNIIFDLNISEIQDVFNIAIKNSYNFILIEPDGDKIKISFKKDKVDKEALYIKYPTYTKILLKAKNLTKLEIEGTEDEQQGQGKLRLNAIDYKIFVKTVPSGYGEKLFLKIEEVEIKISNKIKKKTSIMQIFGFLGAISFVTLVVGGSFLAFLVLSAKTPADVQFFANLGINLNDINTFVGKTITIIFSIVIFIETIFLIIFLFKFILTKKSYKKKKIYYGLISALTLIVTFSSGTAWMIINSKISALPNWAILSLGNIQIYDNSKLKSERFDRNSSILVDTTNLIGPLTIKYDLSNYQKSEEDNGFTIKKYIWDFGEGEIIEKIEPTIIHNFNKKGNYDVSLVIEEIDLNGKPIEKQIKDIKPIDIGYIVKINEKRINNGGKTIEFDASDVSELGNIEWYYGDDLEPVWKGETFKPGKPIFEETLVGMSITNSSKKNTSLDKIFIIAGENENSIKGSIVAKQTVLNDLEYEIKVKDPENDFGDGFINEFKRVIGKKEITKEGDIANPEESSKIHFIFENYGKHKIKVTLKDSSGKTKELETIIDIPKKLKLTKGIEIVNDGEIIEDIRYSSKNKEYFIDKLLVPTVLTLDSRLVKPDNILYNLKDVTWDIDSNGDIDGKGKVFEYPVDIEGNHYLTINYTFVHKKIKDDKISFQEIIYTEGIKKEALLSLKIEKDSSYAPILVRFDASKSQVKNQNIVKFIWDYGDSTPIEERGSINPGHRYNKAGDYTIKLTVVTEEGNEYFIEKKLILNPKPQNAKINVSMNKAPVGQGIEFSSEQSEGQIESYFWDFGNGKSSFEANPSHTYTKRGKYKIKLKIDFANNNQLIDTKYIEIY